MSDTPRTKEEWKRLQRLPNGLYNPKVTTMDLAIGMTRLAEGLERECDGLRRAYDIALRQMNQAIAKAEWLRTHAIADLERQRDEARATAHLWQDRWMNNTPLEECGGTLMPWMVGWKDFSDNDDKHEEIQTRRCKDCDHSDQRKIPNSATSHPQDQ